MNGKMIFPAMVCIDRSVTMTSHESCVIKMDIQRAVLRKIYAIGQMKHMFIISYYIVLQLNSTKVFFYKILIENTTQKKPLVIIFMFNL